MVVSDKFGVTVKDDDGGDIKFVLTRRGFDWKLTAIIVLHNTGHSVTYPPRNARSTGHDPSDIGSTVDVQPLPVA